MQCLCVLFLDTDFQKHTPHPHPHTPYMSPHIHIDCIAYYDNLKLFIEEVQILKPCDKKNFSICQKKKKTEKVATIPSPSALMAYLTPE